jgi:hypothetical protein
MFKKPFMNSPFNTTCNAKLRLQAIPRALTELYAVDHQMAHEENNHD